MSSSGSSSDTDGTSRSGSVPPQENSGAQPPSETQKAIAALKPGYPATALINVLLQHYNIDFAKYKRNTKISHKLLELWGRIYDAILVEMDKVQKAGDTPDWNAFDKYTGAIAPFEEELLKLEAILADNELPPLPPNDEVTPLIVFMGKWVEDRQKFIDTGKNLDEAHFTALFPQALGGESIVKGAIRDDDSQILGELTNKIRDDPMLDTDIMGIGPDDKLVTAVKEKVQAIKTAADALAPEDCEKMGKVVFAVMAIYIPFLAHAKNAEDAHIVSKEVWDAAKTFADQTEAFAQKSSSIAADVFDGQWKEYETVLKKKIGAFAMQMVTLMRLASQARRPFFGRTVGIVRMWQAISLIFVNTRLLEDTEKVFTATHTEVTSFTVDAADLDKRRKAYTDLVGLLKAEVEKYNSAKWSEVQKAYETSAKVDDEHLKKYQEFIKKNKQAADLQAGA
ncbi:hypothetical protein MD484_g912, partial [Candolleomyces efflorescens]